RSRDTHALRRRRRRVAEPGAAEREVLERKPQGLGIGELPFERVERRLQRGELVLVALELVEEVVLRAQRVQLLARELVALRVERNPERAELRAVVRTHTE